MTDRMVAKTTGDGTAASEAALCAVHDTPTNRGTFGAAADTDVTGPWVDATDNDELVCQLCGDTVPLPAYADDEYNGRTPGR